VGRQINELQYVDCFADRSKSPLCSKPQARESDWQKTPIWFY